jgi:carboxyl-terminal processing protease
VLHTKCCCAWDTAVADLWDTIDGWPGSARGRRVKAISKERRNETPDRVPVGYAADKRWATRDLSSMKASFPRLGKIPSSTRFLWLLGLRYLPAFITKSPIVLESEGLGPKPYDGNIVLLVDRHTASAAEMVTVFAKENKLATIGEKTAGRLLSATSVKVGTRLSARAPDGGILHMERHRS